MNESYESRGCIQGFGGGQLNSWMDYFSKIHGSE